MQPCGDPEGRQDSRLLLFRSLRPDFIAARCGPQCQGAILCIVPVSKTGLHCIATLFGNRVPGPWIVPVSKTGLHCSVFTSSSPPLHIDRLFRSLRPDFIAAARTAGGPAASELIVPVSKTGLHCSLSPSRRRIALRNLRLFRSLRPDFIAAPHRPDQCRR